MGKTPAEAEAIYRYYDSYTSFMNARKAADSNSKLHFSRLWNSLRTFKSVKKLDTLEEAYRQHRALVLDAADTRIAREMGPHDESLNNLSDLPYLSDPDEDHTDTDQSDNAAQAQQHDRNASQHVARSSNSQSSLSPMAYRQQQASRSSESQSSSSRVAHRQPQTHSDTHSDFRFRHYETVEELLADFGATSQHVTATLASNPALRDDFMAIFNNIAHTLHQPERLRAIRECLLDDNLFDNFLSDYYASSSLTTPVRKRGRSTFDPSIASTVRRSQNVTGLTPVSYRSVSQSINSDVSPRSHQTISQSTIQTTQGSTNSALSSSVQHSSASTLLNTIAPRVQRHSSRLGPPSNDQKSET